MRTPQQGTEGQPLVPVLDRPQLSWLAVSPTDLENLHVPIRPVGPEVDGILLEDTDVQESALRIGRYVIGVTLRILADGMELAEDRPPLLLRQVIHKRERIDLDALAKAHSLSSARPRRLSKSSRSTQLAGVLSSILPAIR